MRASFIVPAEWVADARRDVGGFGDRTTVRLYSTTLVYGRHYSGQFHHLWNVRVRLWERFKRFYMEWIN